MAFIPVAAALVELFFTQHGINTEMTCWMTNTTLPFSLANLESLSEEINAAAVEHLVPHMPNTTFYRGHKLSDQSSIAGSVIENFMITPASGDLAFVGLPNQCTFTVTFGTTGRGKSRRGRWFWPGLPMTTSLIAGNSLDSEQASDIVEGTNLFFNAISVSGWYHVVASRRSGEPPYGDGFTTAVTNYKYFDLLIDSQRRRKD